MNYNIACPFFESARRFPEKLALFADGKGYSYREMLDRVVRVADWLSGGGEGSSKRVGILGSRSMEACVGILAAAWVGAAFVPISLKQPELGVAALLKRSGLLALITDKNGSQMLTSRILEQAPAEILSVREAVLAGVSEAVIGFNELPPAAHLNEPVVVDASAPACVLYTSGSTGTPKGVMLSSSAISHLLNAMQKDYPLSCEDRVAETTDISFDLSIYNMFAAWRAGASLHVVPPAQAMAPAKFVQEQEISAWLSVPSIAVFMDRMGLLKPGTLPSLRYSFFAGEPLFASVAEAWHKAAPHSIVANMYGPTEATVVCIGQEYSSRSIFTRDCVAIGRPFAGMQAAIARREVDFAPVGVQGELLLSGPQLALGYFDDPLKTADQFVTIDGKRWYKTGDLAYCDENGLFHYLGRVDNQVKILGCRVELEEIEHHLRDWTGCTGVAAVAWPRQGGSPSGVVGFVANYGGNAAEVKAAMQQRLPSYMVPTQVHLLPELPTNSNGKVDRNALVTFLDEGLIV